MRASENAPTGAVAVDRQSSCRPEHRTDGDVDGFAASSRGDGSRLHFVKDCGSDERFILTDRATSFSDTNILIRNRQQPRFLLGQQTESLSDWHCCKSHLV